MSSQPRTQLSKARASLESMRQSQSIEAFGEHWKNLLHYIERTWTKAVHKYDPHQGWRTLRAKYESLRKNDPLLAYVKSARDTDEHTVNEIVAPNRAESASTLPKGNSLFIERMEIGRGKISIKSPQKVRVDFLPGKTKLLPEVKRDRTYDVPALHLGDAIDSTNVIKIAEKVVIFYEGFLDEAESTLGK